MKKAPFVKFLKSLKNSLTDESRELAIAVQELISEAERSEEEWDADRLRKAVTDIIAETTPEIVDAPEVESKIRTVVREFVKQQNGINKGGYLSTKEAVKDFAASIRRAKSAEDFTTAWTAKLTANGISGMVYPELVSTGIENIWQGGTGLLSEITKVADSDFRLLYTADDGADTLAHGHKKGDTKKEQAFAVSAKKLELQAIYKDLYVDRIDLVKMESDTALIEWITSELADRLAHTIERAIISGDPNSGDYVITSFEAIGTKTATDAFTSLATGTMATLAETIFGASVDVDNKGRAKWLYIAPDALKTLSKRTYATGGTPVFIGREQIAAELGVDRIEPWKYFADGVKAVIITPALYARVGGEPFGEQWSMYTTNKEAFRAEIFAGGGISGLKSTAVIKVSDSSAS